jgi:diaminohydroxyphosphoribosylaminopyrimidine deaminase / 5-amino-6-(5-phosphoribosylamino)uracil reductase
MTDESLMRRALALAARGWGQTAPNPMVGAVVVGADGQVVGEGWHAQLGAPHAEVVALGQAGTAAHGGTLYVTLEPCAHHGRTPPCADAVIAAGVRRVVYAASDPNPVARGGAGRLRQAGIEVTSGVCELQAVELNAPFHHAFASPLPWVTLKLAVSLDGMLAPAGGVQQWLTGAASRREVHRLRAGADAVAVGSGTALADDPRLDVREHPSPRVPPLRVVFDRRLRLPLESRLVRTARDLPTLVVCADDTGPAAARLAEAGVQLLPAATLEDALRALRDRGVRSLLAEGGAALAGSLLSQGLVHRLVTFQAPVILGSDALGAFSGVVPGAALDRLVVGERRILEDDVMTMFSIRPAPCSPA